MTARKSGETTDFTNGNFLAFIVYDRYARYYYCGTVGDVHTALPCTLSLLFSTFYVCLYVCMCVYIFTYFKKF